MAVIIGLKITELVPAPFSSTWVLLSWYLLLVGTRCVSKVTQIKSRQGKCTYHMSCGTFALGLRVKIIGLIQECVEPAFHYMLKHLAQEC